MATVQPPYAMQNLATHTAETDRMMLSGMQSGERAAGSLISQGGVNLTAGSGMLVTQTGSPSMAVQVAAGIAYVPGSEGSKQGVYCCINDGNVTVSLDPAHGSLPRIDAIIVQVQDQNYSGGDNTWVITKVTGTAASLPVAPALPVNSLVLAHASVAAGDTAITNSEITDRRHSLTAIGGALIAEANNTPPIAQYQEGQLWVVPSTGDIRVKRGGAWVSRTVDTTQNTYTPAWTSIAGAQPVVGNGSLVGRYARVGSIGFVWINQDMGSTSSYGGSAWEYSLPAGWVANTATGQILGNGMIRDNSAAVQRAIALYASSDGLRVGGRVNDANQLGTGVPWAWATSDNCKFILTVPLV